MRRDAATERILRTCQKTTSEGEGHTVQGMSSNWLGLSSFGLGAAGMFATVYCTQAILPTLGREFGVGAARTGLTISVVVVAMAAGAWIWGPLSDRIGRKRCLVLSSGLLVAPTVGLGLAPSFAVLLLCRLLQGLCMPGLLAVGLNYVQEVFGDWLGGKAMGCYLSSLVAGGLIGRVGVALASEVVGWRLSIAGLALLPSVAALFMHYALPQSASPAKEKQELAAVMRLLGNRALLLATLGGCALFFSFVGVFSFVTYYLEAPPFSLSPAIGSLIFLLWSLGVVGPVAGAVADRKRIRPRVGERHLLQLLLHLRSFRGLLTRCSLAVVGVARSHRHRSWGIGAGRGHLDICTSRSRASPEALARIIHEGSSREGAIFAMVGTFED